MAIEAVPTNKTMEFNLPAAYFDIYVKVKSNEYASEADFFGPYHWVRANVS